MGIGADPDINIALDIEESAGLSAGNVVLRYVVGAHLGAGSPPGPGFHDPSPGISLSDRGDLVAAAVTSKAAWLDYLDTYHHAVYSFVVAASSARQDRWHLVTTLL